MKILHVITGLRKAAGTSEFVGELANELVAFGNEVTIVVVNPDAADCHPLDKRVRLIPFADLAHQSALPDLVHLHGLWEMPIHYACRWARRNRLPIIWSPHGALSPWSMRHKRWKKFLPWHLYQKRDIVTAEVLHATTQLEAEWNARFHFPGRTIVVPLGVHLPAEVRRRVRIPGEPLHVLFVGRVYPVKGLANVVRAAALLKEQPIRFRIVGPDQAGHLADLKAEAEGLGVSEMFEWVGPKYGAELAAEYDACDLLILPSFTENFGATVIQALAHAKPVLASRFTPWQILEERKCGWWVSNEPSALAEAFQSIAGLPTKTFWTIGENGRKLAEERYSWKSVGGQMAKAYEWLLRKGKDN